jgi:hypothetical protein
MTTLTINSAGDCHVFEFLLVLLVNGVEIVAGGFLDGSQYLEHAQNIRITTTDLARDRDFC